MMPQTGYIQNVIQQDMWERTLMDVRLTVIIIFRLFLACHVNILVALIHKAVWLQF